jgi:hypothetical protein
MFISLQILSTSSEYGWCGNMLVLKDGRHLSTLPSNIVCLGVNGGYENRLHGSYIGIVYYLDVDSSAKPRLHGAFCLLAVWDEVGTLINLETPSSVI